MANGVRGILASGATMLWLGGDHFVAHSLLRAHAEKHGPLALNHGTMFNWAVKEGLVDPKRSAQIGIRTWNDDFIGLELLGAVWVHDSWRRRRQRRC